MKQIYDWFSKNPAIGVALIAGIFTLFGGFLTAVIWPLVNKFFVTIWDMLFSLVRGRRADHRYVDWLINEHQYLPILPTTLVPVTAGGHNQELDQLYVSLTVQAESKDQHLDLASALNAHDALIILGDPGAGKTTMARFLALTFARAYRKLPSGTGVDRKKMKLKIKEARNRVHNQFKLSRPLMPVFIYLNRLRAADKWTKDFSLLDAIKDEFKSVSNIHSIPDNFLERKLARGQCLFLFDAFDELGSENTRQAVAVAIGHLASSIALGSKVIVTSRIVGYNGQLGAYGFKALRIERLDWHLIEQLTNKWYEVLGEKGLAEDLLRALKNNSRIFDLAANPMLLSLITLVQYVKRLIPDKRHVLYDECIRILVERRFAPPSVQQYYNKILPSDEALELLQTIALTMHEQGLREVSRNRLEEKIIPVVTRTMKSSKAASLTGAQVLKNIEERSQLLVERGLNEQGEPLMAFSHLTFQEYLASVAYKDKMVTKGEDAIIAQLLSRYEQNPKWWEEVTLLFAAQLTKNRQDTFMAQVYPHGSQIKSE